MSGKVTAKQIMEEVSNGLRVSLTIGAASSDAEDDPEKLQALHEGIILPLEIYRATGEPEFLLRAVHDTMGADWEPTGDWAEYLDAIGK